MTLITKLKGANAEEIASDLRNRLTVEGYKANISIRNPTSVNIQNIRRAKSDNLHTVSYRMGYSKTPKATNILTWDNWVEVNNDINRILSKKKASANVKSLGGKFKIREGIKEYTEEDWEHLKYENVGSQMNPITRENSIISTKTALAEG